MIVQHLLLAALASGTISLSVFDLSAAFIEPTEPSTFLSWRLEGADDSVQIAFEYNIYAASSSAAAAPLYSVSGASSHPRVHLRNGELQGRLPPGHYSARVRVRGAGAWSALSPPAPLVMGLGARDLAGASWVCTAANATPNSHTSMLRAEFSVPSEGGAAAINATLFIVGLGQFQARLNGARVSNDTMTPGWTDWRSRLFYSAYAVDPAALHVGGEQPNALAVLLGNSMYNVPQPLNGRYTKGVWSSGPRMLYVQLRVGYSDGTQLTVLTSDAGASAAWLGTEGGWVTLSHQYAGEDSNATLATPGWDQPGFSPATSNPLVPWAPAQDCTPHAPPGALQLSPFPAIGVMETLPLARAAPAPPRPGVLVLDFGKNFAGYAGITVNASTLPPGAQVRVTPSETLGADGDIRQCSGGCPMWWSYTLPVSALEGEGEVVELAPVFGWTGFRWVTVEVLGGGGAAAPSAAAAAATSGAGSSTGSGSSITILNATFGGGCDARLAGDATAAVAQFCNGKGVCPYYVCLCGWSGCHSGPSDAPCWTKDPAPNCPKDFGVLFACTSNSSTSSTSSTSNTSSSSGSDTYFVYLPAEAAGSTANLSCTPPPPPYVPPSPPRIVGARGYFTRASVPTVGHWASASPWVNAIHGITLEAVKANLQSVLTDCPHRERLGWLEVSHLMFPSMAYNFDLRALWGKISRDTRDSQLPSGMVPDIAPEYTVFSGGFRDSPEWGSAAVLNPHWVHAWYGDAATLNATFATGVRYVDYLLRQRNGAGLLSYGLGDWIPIVPSPVAVTATATLVQDLQALAAGARALGLPPAVAENYTALAGEVGAAFHAAFWSNSSGGGGGGGGGGITLRSALRAWPWCWA